MFSVKPEVIVRAWKCQNIEAQKYDERIEENREDVSISSGHRKLDDEKYDEKIGENGDKCQQRRHREQKGREILIRRMKRVSSKRELKG